MRKYLHEENMKRDLHELEHEILPRSVYYSKEIGSRLGPVNIAKNFSDMCDFFLRKYHIGSETFREAFHSETETVNSPVSQYFLTRLTFPFMKGTKANTYCPRAYLLYDGNGEKPRYYSVEYDCSNGLNADYFWMCAWIPEKTASGIKSISFINLGPVTEKEERQLVMTDYEKYLAS